MSTTTTKVSEESQPLLYKVYTDGSCYNRDKLGVAGMGSAVSLNGELICENESVELGMNSNSAEMKAALMGIESVIDNFYLAKDSKIRVFSDSNYVVNTINKWMYLWKRQGFMVGFNKDRRKRPNHDMISQIFSLAQQHSIDAKWVKGHVGISMNEHVNNIANDARKKYIEEYGAV